MAESSNFTSVVVYKSETPGNIPAAVNLQVGELALNIADKTFYTKNSLEEIVEIGPSSLLDGITNIEITDLQDGDILVYNGVTDTWENQENVSTDGITDPDGHRYWRILFGLDTAPGLISVQDCVLYVRGGGFQNGERFDKGIAVSPTNFDASLAGINVEGDPDNFFTGSTITVSPLAPSSYGGVSVDFGTDSNNNPIKVSLTGIDIKNTNNLDNCPDVIEISYSDNGVEWTVTSVITEVAAKTDNILSPTGPLPHFANMNWGRTVGTVVLFDENMPTIPPVGDQLIPEGGTTNQVLSKASNADYDVEWVDTRWLNYIGTGSFNITATPGNYYLCSANGATVDLPAVPSDGDRIGIRNLSNFSELSINPLGADPIEGENTSTHTFTLSINDTTSPVLEYVVLVYTTVDGTLGWWAVDGRLNVTPLPSS